MTAKYIVFKSTINLDTDKTPIVFPSTLPHREVSKVFVLLGLRPVSAGFCYIDEEGSYKCYGRSESLNIDSDIADSDTLNIKLNAI